ncbi:MAG: hypothetical protein WBG58_19075 [Ignavibacteriaceae bacterium]
MYKNLKISTPVALLIFNRPDTTKKVFEEIRKAEPERLFVIADGPRNNVERDNDLCKLTREITENIDWDCKVTRDYSVENYGLRKRVSGGLTRMFKSVDEAIILEDDCVPHQSFFPFCQELLERYRDERKVMMISGNNFLGKLGQKECSYHFSAFNLIWGWATWKRAWNLYDDEMNDWNDLKEGDFLNNILQDDVSVKYYRTIFQEVYEDKINSWAYRWLYSMFREDGLSIVPSNNLVTNIGFGTEATNAKSNSHHTADIIAEEIEFPLMHPPKTERDLEADMFATKILHRFRGKDLIIRTIKKLLRM